MSQYTRRSRQHRLALSRFDGAGGCLPADRTLVCPRSCSVGMERLQETLMWFVVTISQPLPGSLWNSKPLPRLVRQQNPMLSVVTNLFVESGHFTSHSAFYCCLVCSGLHSEDGVCPWKMGVRLRNTTTMLTRSFNSAIVIDSIRLSPRFGRLFVTAWMHVVRTRHPLHFWWLASSFE